jgi:hypothetical protein
MATAPASDERGPTFDEAPLSTTALADLLTTRPELRLDYCDRQPSAAQLAERLGAFWLPDEVVLYIGLAGQPLRRRVRQYYRTPLGERRPHAGGWWLKMLSVLSDLHVYWAASPTYASAEKEMLVAFAAGTSPTSRQALHDSARVMPFANLRGADNRIKRHGLTDATGE